MREKCLVWQQKNSVLNVKYSWEQKILKDKNLIVMPCRNGAEIVPVYTGSRGTLVDAVSECMRYWVSNCDTTHMCVGSTVGPNIFVKICG